MTESNDILATLPVEHISYSAMRLFLSNPYQFKKNYILGLWDYKQSPSAVVGKSFHKFAELIYKGQSQDSATQEAIKMMDKIPDSDIDFGKTGSREKMAKDLNKVIEFFLHERPDVGKVLGAEVKVTTNFEIDGIMSPLPVKAISDLVSEINGDIHIWDWKVLTSHTDLSEEKPDYVMQAQFNYETVKAKYGKYPKAIHYVEIKKSKNRSTDGKQINIYTIEYDKHPEYKQGFLYMYEAVIRQMVNSNYLFLPNFSDMFSGKESFTEFLSEKIDVTMPSVTHKSALVKMTDRPQFVESTIDSAVGENMTPAERVISKFLEFGIALEHADSFEGSSVTLHRFKPSRGVKMAQLVKYESDIMIALGVKSVRIIAPIKGTKLVGVEVSNETQAVVEWSEDMLKPSSLVIPVGQDVYNRPFHLDIAKAPHLLVAGATGSGKSVGLNVIIKSLIEQNTPQELNLVLIDPKMTEFNHLMNDPHVDGNVFSEVEDISLVLKWAIQQMNDRYTMMRNKGIRKLPSEFPKIVIVIDEMADLMLSPEKFVDPETDKMVKYSGVIEADIIRLTQKSRAAGIHLVLATQRPSVDVIKGTLKANLPTRIAYMTATQTDSKVILDQAGAEQLLGNGDCLVLDPRSQGLTRLQGYYLKEDE